MGARPWSSGWHWAIGALLLTGCGGKQSADHQSACEPGSELCECTAAGECAGDLVCASGICVEFAAGTGGRSDGRGGAESTSGGSGSPSTGGSGPAGQAGTPPGPDDTGGQPGSGGTGGIDASAGQGGEGATVATGGAQPVAGCGDGVLDDDETCDDGNVVVADGCNGVCQREPYYTCSEPGSACVLDIACGNGVIEAGEVCDDGNVADDDGCSADCTEQSRNYVCDIAGESCERVIFCGDGRVAGAETCEDGNTSVRDGCDADCNVEPGWLCAIPGEPCTPQPICGDGVVTVGIGEACDDGNVIGGDGCAADCSFQEGGWLCPLPGAPCQSLHVCGDGAVTGAEDCDDGNDESSDGCSRDCTEELGYDCPIAGARCVAKCGDGILVAGQEACDDGNTNDGDGCDARCHWEAGFACVGSPGNYTCVTSVCGDAAAVGLEPCDDGNHELGDGCSPLCQLEPSCDANGCTTECGDGIVAGDEECDDGNTSDDDGCSSDCTVEANSSCGERPLGDDETVPMVLRDFRESHPDFEPSVSPCAAASLDLVQDRLDSAGRPVLAAADGVGCAHTTSVESFAEWWREDSASTTIASELSLWSDDQHRYANRWGDDGELWQDAGGNPHEGSPLWFPVDASGFTPASELSSAVVPEAVFGGGDQPEPGEPLHNFHFTSEVRLYFEYQPGLDQAIDVAGTDDIWVFVNRRLAIDLGGIHLPLEQVVRLNDIAASFSIEAGDLCELAVFQAQRRTPRSSFRLAFAGLNVAPSECTGICGDGLPTRGEICDDGSNLGGYGRCNPDCTLGEHCGDGIVQAEYEVCDNGENRDSYGSTGCAPGCQEAPFCGDGIIQGAFDEQCDDGDNDGAYGGCTPSCQRAPFCGDGNTDASFDEECDDGLNNGAYNTCGPGCVLGPRCGDGALQDEWGEICDDGNNDAGDGCSPVCGEDGGCGDGFVAASEGEQCDDGANDGGYGECAPGCVLGPRCGDGVVNGPETCDDAVNDGGYGACAPGCVLGPRCGDTVVQAGYEDCDDGNVVSGDGCSAWCAEE